MSTNSDRSKKSVFSEWLEKLQQESWQLELLISGLALFGIWESRSALYNFEYYLDTNAIGSYVFYTNALITTLWAGWAIFFINLLAHIIVRGLWIGAIGLRYVSGDIDYDELNFSDVFKRYFKRRIGSFDDYIERLERLSSVLFSFTFLLFFIIFSFVFLNVVYGVIVSAVNSIFYPDFDSGPTPFAMLFGGLFYGLGLVVLIDFITLGGFKKVKDKTFSRGYLALYRFYSTVSLSFIYRPLLLNFIDDRYTKRLFFFAFPYVLIMLLGVSYLSFEKYSFIPSFTQENRYFNYPNKYAINWNNYDDLRLQHHETFSVLDRPETKSEISVATIDRYQIDNDLISLFLEYEKSDSKLLSRLYPNFLEFKKTGLRHRLFSKGIVEDTVLEELIAKRTSEIKLMLKVVRGQETEIDSSDAITFLEEIKEYKGYTIDDIADLRSQILDKYLTLRKEHADHKIKTALDAVYSNYQIWIDDIEYTDSLSYFFYTHPNSHEQGLLCNISIDKLSKGDHLITIEKRRDKDDCMTDCPTTEKFIPFRKTN